MHKPRAFVIMPFADELKPVFDQLIQPALNYYEVERADTRLDERGILEKIVTGIHEADLVVADITNASANVMYELGVAHALGKPTIMIAQSVQNVPFDVHAYPVHEYSTHFARATELAKTLRELADKHRAGELLFANPVTDFIPSVAEPPISISVAPAVEYSLDNVHDDLAVATSGIAQFGKDFAAASERFGARMNVIIPTIIPEKHARETALNNVADAIRDLGLAMDGMSALLHETWKLYGRATAWLLAPQQASQIPSEYRLSFAQTAQSIDDTMNEILASIANLRTANDGTPRETGNLTHAIEMTHDALTRLLNEIMTGKAHLARAVSGFTPAQVESA